MTSAGNTNLAVTALASSPDKTLTVRTPSAAWSNSDLRPRNDRQTLDMTIKDDDRLRFLLQPERPPP